MRIYQFVKNCRDASMTGSFYGPIVLENEEWSLWASGFVEFAILYFCDLKTEKFEDIIIHK